MSQHEAWIGALVLMVVLFLLGRYAWPSRRVGYEDGWTDRDDQAQEMQRELLDRIDVLEGEREGESEAIAHNRIAYAALDAPRQASREAVSPDTWRADTDAGVNTRSDRSSPHDWLTEVHEALSPEHIQDTPGPVVDTWTSRASQDSRDGGNRGALSPSAGGLNWWDETPLPAVLGLGQEFSGDDRTFARWQVRRWEFRRQMGLGSIEAA